MKNIKKVLFDTFENPKSKNFVFANDFFALLTIISILGLIFETVGSLQPYYNILSGIEYFTVFFFTFEYIGRLAAAPKKLRYVFSFYGMIDLLSIIPTYLGAANLTFLKSARLVRMLRFLRMLRLAKVARMSRSTNKNNQSANDKLFRLNLEIYFFTLFSIATLSGTFIFIFESHRPEFANIPLGILWAIKVILGGTAQHMPLTLPGELVTIITRFVGLLLFGLLINLVGNSTKRILFGTENIEPQ